MIINLFILLKRDVYKILEIKFINNSLERFVMNIENLNKEIKNCKKCRVYETRTNAICGEGGLYTKLIIVAQSPGENEDKEGRMFIGPSVKILNDLFRSANISRKTIYITNLTKCMLPKYRRPKHDEIDSERL